MPRLTDETVRERIVDLAEAAWREREAQVGPELMRQFERSLMLQTLDHHWRDHLAALDHLRQGIHLRGYAQKNPKQEYKREAFELFSDMLDRIKQDVVKVVLTVTVRSEQDVQAVEEAETVSNVKYQHADYDEALAATASDGDPWPRAAAAVHACRRKGRAQRSLSVRFREEIQALPRPHLTDQTRDRDSHVPNARQLHAADARIAAARARRDARRDAAAKIKNWDARRRAARRCASRGTVAAGVFTQNRFCAAPVVVCRDHLARQHATGSDFRALVVNAGNANAGTGERGLADARAECVAVARLLDCAPEEVLPFSTGVIMEPLPVDKIVAGSAGGARRGARDGWFAAANAIMTTDTVPKGASRRVDRRRRRR